MKKIIFILSIFSLSASANFVKVSNLDLYNLGIVWMRLDDCERVHQESCIELPRDLNPEYHRGIYSRKRNIINCEDEDHCRTFINSPCENPEANRIIGAEYKETYCTRLIRIGIDREKKRLWDLKSKRVEQDLTIRQREREHNRRECRSSPLTGEDLSNEQIRTLSLIHIWRCRRRG